MRKTLIALMFAAALPTVAMAMPEGRPDGARWTARTTAVRCTACTVKARTASWT